MEIKLSDLSRDKAIARRNALLKAHNRINKEANILNSKRRSWSKNFVYSLSEIYKINEESMLVFMLKQNMRNSFFSIFTGKNNSQPSDILSFSKRIHYNLMVEYSNSEDCGLLELAYSKNEKKYTFYRKSVKDKVKSLEEISIK